MNKTKNDYMARLVARLRRENEIMLFTCQKKKKKADDMTNIGKLDATVLING